MTAYREEDFDRPSFEEIKSKWKLIFADPLISPSRLRSDALSKDGLGEMTGPEGGVVLRSLYWRFYHNLLPPPTSLDLFAHSLATSREGYNALRRRYLVAPDGRWASDCTGGQGSTPPPTSASSTFSPTPPSTHAAPPAGGGEGWDPLSLSTSSPWKTWFQHVDLRSTIAQDVERTFPDIPYFQLARVRKCLTTSLFLFAVLNPDVGYRQGMHELLACCFMAVDRDSIDLGDGDALQAGVGDILGDKGDGQEVMRNTLDRNHVEHDAFALFQAIMKSAKAFYEWRAEEGPVRTRGPSAPQAPIIIRCNNIHTSLIRRIDPQLWERLETEGVEAQIWAIRWIRLIFTRELPFAIAMRIWDGVFAEDPGLGILDFVCMAMLLLIRSELIEADYPTLLTQLLHYPAPSSAYPVEPFLILSQALFLRNNISPAAGVEVVLQNQDILGVRATPPERPAEDRAVPMRGRGGLSRGSAGRGRGGRPGVGGLAQGLFERAQAAGLDKAFLSTVADLRKNLPDSATAYSYLPNLPFSPSGTPSREANSPFSSIPNSASALPSRTYNPSPPVVPRPPIQTRPSVDSAASVQSLKDAELEMAELRLAMVGMGKAMSEWLDLLHPTPRSDQDGVSVTIDDGDKENAWRGLMKIQESLLDAAGKETDEIVREWGWHDGLETASSKTASTPVLPPDTPSTSNGQQYASPAQVPPTTAVPPSDGSVDAVPSNTERGQLEFEDSTPTPLSVSAFPNVPSLPSVPHLSSHSVSPRTQSQPPPTTVPPTALAPSSARQDGTSAPKSGPGAARQTPTISLSSRAGTPSTTLPRTPLTAPLSNGYGYATGRQETEGEKVPHTALGFGDGDATHARGRGASRGGDNGTDGLRAEDGDPLAGLGVGTISQKDGTAGGGRKPFASFSSSLRDGQRASGSGSGGVDPLLGLGMR